MNDMVVDLGRGAFIWVWYPWRLVVAMPTALAVQQLLPLLLLLADAMAVLLVTSYGSNCHPSLGWGRTLCMDGFLHMHACSGSVPVLAGLGETLL